MILCSQCPRSYCNNCLTEVLSKNRFDDIMANSSDWTCMCCHFSLSHNPPLSRDAWKPVAFSRSSLSSLMKIAASPRAGSNSGVSTPPPTSAVKNNPQVELSPQSDNHVEDVDVDDNDYMEENDEEIKPTKHKIVKSQSTKLARVDGAEFIQPTTRVTKRIASAITVPSDEAEDGEEFNILFDISGQVPQLKFGSKKKSPAPPLPIPLKPLTTNKKQKVASSTVAIPPVTAPRMRLDEEKRSKKANTPVDEEPTEQRKSDRKRPPTRSVSPTVPELLVSTESTGRYTTRGIGVRKSYSDIVRGDFYHSEIASAKAASMADVVHKKKDFVPKRERPTNAHHENPLSDDLSIESVETAAIKPLKKSNSTKRSVAEDNVLEIPNPQNQSGIVDEVYYFGIYLNYYYDNVYSLTKDRRALLTITDDACFLCKDGGDLVECDCFYPSNRNSRCLKTYHECCLGFKLQEDQEFRCMRHFCDICGETTLKYVCYFCPISLCANCPESFVEKVSGIFCFQYFLSSSLCLVWFAKLC